MFTLVTYVLVTLCGSNRFHTRQEATRLIKVLNQPLTPYIDKLRREYIYWSDDVYMDVAEHKLYYTGRLLDKKTIEWGANHRDPEIRARVRTAVKYDR